MILHPYQKDLQCYSAYILFVLVIQIEQGALHDLQGLETFFKKCLLANLPLQ